MALGSISVVAQKLGEIRVPLFQAPYTADSGTQSFLVQSFNAALWEASSVQPDSVFIQELTTSFLTPRTKITTTYGSGASSGHAWGGAPTANAMVGGIIGTVVSVGTGMGETDNDLFFGMATGNKLNAQLPFISAVAAGLTFPGIGACAPQFCMVQIQNSPPLYLPCIFLSCWVGDPNGTDFNLILYNPQAVGPPTPIWFGHTIPGGLVGGKILPQSFALTAENARSLTYGDSTLNTKTFIAHLPDIDNQINRWLVSDAPLRILSFLPGQITPGNIAYNQDGWQAFITFDNTAFNTADINAQQASKKGFLLRVRVGPTDTQILLKPDGSGYYTLKLIPEDAVSADIISTDLTGGTAIDLGGVFYAKKTNGAPMANSFGISGLPPTPIGGNVLTVGLPCFEPCLPWPHIGPGEPP